MRVSFSFLIQPCLFVIIYHQARHRNGISQQEQALFPEIWSGTGRSSVLGNEFLSCSVVYLSSKYSDIGIASFHFAILSRKSGVSASAPDSRWPIEQHYLSLCLFAAQAVVYIGSGILVFSCTLLLCMVLRRDRFFTLINVGVSSVPEHPCSLSNMCKSQQMLWHVLLLSRQTSGGLQLQAYYYA